MHHFEPEAGDPRHEPAEGLRIRQFSAKGCRSPADGDHAVVKFCAKRVACLTDEGDLVRLGLHRDCASTSRSSLDVHLVVPACLNGGVCFITHPGVKKDFYLASSDLTSFERAPYPGVTVVLITAAFLGNAELFLRKLGPLP